MRTDTGYTLIEVLVVAVIAVILIATTYTVATGRFSFDDPGRRNKSCDGSTLVYTDWDGNVTAAVPNSHECQRKPG